MKQNKLNDYPLEGISSDDTHTHSVVKGYLSDQNERFNVVLAKPKNKRDGMFLLSAVKRNRKVVWMRKWLGRIQCITPLFVAEDGTPFVAFVSCYGRNLDGLLAFTEVAAEGGGLGDSSIDVQQMIAYKKEAREFFLLSNLSYTDAEQALLDEIQKAERRQEEAAHQALVEERQREKDERKRELEAARNAELEKKAAARSSKLARKRERVSRIFNRPKVTCFTAEGFRRYGVPVVGNEWESLPNDTFVISVSSFNDETGNRGEVIYAFEVDKSSGGHCSMKNKTPVFESAPKSTRRTEKSAPRVVTNTTINFNGAFIPVTVYESMEDIRAARENGLNGGTHVGLFVKDKPKTVMVYRLGTEIESVGHRKHL